MILGLLRPDTGSIQLVAEGSKKIGGIIEKPALYGYLSARDNLKVFAKMQGSATQPSHLENCLQAVGLPLDRTDAVRHFSMGMKQRLGIAIALLNDPKCLVLDEPFSGLDPVGIQSLKNLIQSLARKQNLAILISSHIVTLLAETSDTIHVMREGRIMFSGAPSTLLERFTTTYQICGPQLRETDVWKEYPASFHGTCATVTIPHGEISALLQKLVAANIAITSCTPQLDMNQLFHTSV